MRDLDRVPQRPGERLHHGLADVVRLLALEHPHVHGGAGVVGETAEELAEVEGREAAAVALEAGRVERDRFVSRNGRASG